MKKQIKLIIFSFLVIFALVGCASFDFAATGDYIVAADDAIIMFEAGDVILVDVRPEADYAQGHIEGAVNIPVSLLMDSSVTPNMLAGAETIAVVMGAAGVTEHDILLLYCSTNMYAARMQWTLNMFGNFNPIVVSGGFGALEANGANIVVEASTLPATDYVTGEIQKKLLVTLDYLETLIDMPNEDTILIDARSVEEFAAGTIPGAFNVPHNANEYATGEYLISRDIQLRYLGKDITPDMKVIVFCKSGVRAAQAYTALKDAGYQDVRVYDGSVLEYEVVNGPLLPQLGGPAVNAGDAS